MSISTARIRRECEGGTFCHEMAYEVCRERDAQAAELAELRAKLEAAEKELVIDEDCDTPEYGTPAYDLFCKGIDFAIAQLQKVLGVKEWHTSGGGTETIDGDLRSELYDLLKAAGFASDNKTIEQVAAELAALRAAAQAFDDERPVDTMAANRTETFDHHAPPTPDPAAELAAALDAYEQGGAK